MYVLKYIIKAIIKLFEQRLNLFSKKLAIINYLYYNYAGKGIYYVKSKN